MKDQVLRKDKGNMDVYAFLGRITLDVIGESEYNAIVV